MPTFTPLVTVPDDLPAESRWYLVRQGEVLVDDSEAVPVPVKGPEALGFGPVDPAEGPVPGLIPLEAPVVMGWMGEDLCWAVGVDAGAEAPPGYRWSQLRPLGTAWERDEWMLAGRAVQLVE